MEIKQKIEQRKLLIPEPRKSLHILTLPTLDPRSILEDELIKNPLLEETQPDNIISVEPISSSSEYPDQKGKADFSLKFELLTKTNSLQDILLRQLEMFANSGVELKIGQGIIGNIDDNGYLKTSLEDISSSLNVTLKMADNILKLIQRFEPPGVAARTISECLLIQLDMLKDDNPLLRQIAKDHLDDVAKEQSYGK
ncbi:MAG: hypothetical protein ABIA97_04695 [Candidatus Omnitrophota bacterium]